AAVGYAVASSAPVDFSSGSDTPVRPTQFFVPLRAFRLCGLTVYPLRVKLSVVLITCNEELNLGRTLESVKPLVREGQGEIIVVDSGSTDRTVEIAKSFGAKIFVEEWKGYAAQKNSAIDKATGDWILSLDADEELDDRLQQTLANTIESLERVDALRSQPDTHPIMLQGAQAELEDWIGEKVDPNLAGIRIARKNEFLGQWIKHGGFWPDPKLRLFRRGSGRFEDRAVHETVKINGPTAKLDHGALLHHCYPTISDYIQHMN